MGKKGGAVRRVTHPAEMLLQLAPPTTAVDVRILLGQSLAEVRSGRLTPTLAYAISSLATAFLRALDVGDYKSRLEKLEQFQEKFDREGLGKYGREANQ
jgi:hypothetical protein